MSEEENYQSDNLHKRLSVMESEINELNEILLENLDNNNKNKINYLNSDVTINDQIDQDIDDLKNVILNDKIDILDDMNKSATSPLEQKEQQKVNKNWAVYTNQEGRRIHEIPVKQKIKELEQNPNITTTVFTNKTPKKSSVPSLNKESQKESSPSPVSVNLSDKEDEHSISDSQQVPIVDEVKPIKDYKISSSSKTKSPFRVVSVSKSKETSPSIVKPVKSEDENKESFIQKVEASEVDTPYEETNLPSDMDVLLKLYDHICEKINKLTSEIEYIDNIIESRYSYSLTYDELKQFKKGKIILERYLDKKYKQKYELENKVSIKFRQLKLEGKLTYESFFGNN
ncbi:unnamed protein product [Hanseniaspora opuntiae]